MEVISEMNTTQTITLAAIAAYFLIMIFIGLLSSRNQTHEGFTIGNRNVGYIPTMASLAAGFRDGMGIIFWFGFGVVTGYGGLWLFLGAFLGLCTYILVGPQVRRNAADNGYITVGEMLRARFGVITERSTALIIIGFALVMIAIQLNVAGNLFSAVLGVDAWIGVTCISAVVGFYLYFGGYSNVVKTDTIQFFLILSLILMPLFFPPPREAVMNFSSIISLGLQDSLALGLIGYFYAFAGADVWQRVFSARDEKVIKFGFPMAGVMLVIMTLSLIFLGMACAPFLGDEMQASDAFYHIFKNTFISPVLQSFIAIVVMAICMSTLDTLCYLVAATLGKNFMPERVTGERDNYIRFSQITIIIVLIASSVVALSIEDVILSLFDAVSLLYVLAPVYLYAALGRPKLKNRKTDTLVTLAVAGSGMIYLYMFTNGMFEDLIMTSVPVACSIVLTSIAIFIGQRNAT